MGRLLEQLTLFLRSSSLKGVPRTVSDRPAYLRLLWAVSVTLFLAICLYQVATLMIYYRTYPVGVKISERSAVFYGDEPTLELPGLMVCNLQPFSTAAQQEQADVPTVRDYLDLVDAVTACENCSDQLRARWARRRDELLYMRGYFQFVGPLNARRLSHSKETFILDCKARRFSGAEDELVSCSEHNVRVTQHVTSEHFTCWSFHLVNQTVDNAKLGLELVFHLDNYIYYNQSSPSLRSSAGVIVYPVRTAHPAHSRGAEIPAGHSAKVRLTLRGSERLRAPYGSCMTGETQPDFMKPYQLKYMRDTCALLCVNKAVQDMCNCTDVSFPASFLSQNEPIFCQSLNQTRRELAARMDCASKVKIPQRVRCVDEVCHYDCNAMEADLDVSYSRWPTSTNLPFFYQGFIKGKAHQHKYKNFSLSNWGNLSELDLLLTQRLVDENFVRIDFYLGSQLYLVLSEVPQITLANFVSQLGGALNLWSGITVVVFIEIVELCIRLFCPVETGKETSGKIGQGNSEKTGQGNSEKIGQGHYDKTGQTNSDIELQ